MRKITVVVFLLNFLLIPFLNVQAAALSEEEQKEFEKFGGLWHTPKTFKSEAQAIKYLKILIKGDHKTIRWYQKNVDCTDDECNRTIYGQDIANALGAINIKNNKEGLNLAIEVLKTKREYPEAFLGAIRALRFSKEKKVIPLLREISTNESLSVRMVTVEALIELGDIDTAFAVLDKLIKEGSTEGLDYIFYSMEGKKWKQRGIESIRKALSYENKEIKAGAILHLIELNKKGLIKEDTTKLEKIATGIAEEILAKKKWKKPIYGYDDHRTMGLVISVFEKLNSLKAIPLLERISEHPESSYLEANAKETIIKIQLSHCIEPEFKRFIRPAKKGRAHVITDESNIGVLYDDSIYYYYDPLERLLESINISVREIKIPQINSDLVKEVPVLIIPEGTLDKGFPNAGFEKLKAYVIGGGTLLLFAQPKGKSFSRLMEGVEALGYDEDRTSNHLEVSFTNNHPMFAGFSKKSFVMTVGGHFIKYPEKAKLYLKRTPINHPIFLTYPLGKGTIIATTSLTPTGAVKETATEDEIIFFREFLNYLKNPGNPPKVKAGKNVKVKFKVINEDRKEKATKVAVTIYDPERAHERYWKRFSVKLDPGKTSYIEFNYPLCFTAMLGTWHIRYELLAEGYQLMTSQEDQEGTNVWVEYLLQPEREAPDGRFIVTR